MKAKKILSTNSPTKIVLEMSEREATDLFDILARVVREYNLHGEDSVFWSSEAELADSTAHFRSLLGL